MSGSKKPSSTADVTPLARKTKSFVLDGSTAVKIEAMAEILHRTESSLVNEILEKGSAQLILERAPHLAGRNPPHGRIEGTLRLLRPDGRESEGLPTCSFEIVGETSDPGGRSILMGLAALFDPKQRTWRRLDEREARELVGGIHGRDQLFIDTPAGVRWALTDARDVVNRDFAPPLRDVMVQLRRVPALPEGRSTPAPMTFAQLRGFLSAGTPITPEDLRRARLAD